jgi:hypothetical protein
MRALPFIAALGAAAVALTTAHARAAGGCIPAGEHQWANCDPAPDQPGFGGAGPGRGAGGGAGAGAGAGPGDIPGYHANETPGDFGPGYRWEHSGFAHPKYRTDDEEQSTPEEAEGER